MGTRNRGARKASPIAAKVHAGNPLAALGFGSGNGMTKGGKDKEISPTKEGLAPKGRVKVRTLPNNAKRMSG